MDEPNSQPDDLFRRASEIESSERRREFLDQACGGDTELRRQVEALLAAAESGERRRGSAELEPTIDSADEPADVGRTRSFHEVVDERAGASIGPYKLLQPLGEGGMGSVWMAEQEKPVRRTVALKVIKAGMDTRQVIARFEAERQALAMMDHPNIAKVLDAGATVTGRPFFVMELVKGVPITEYCDTHHLTPEARLKLFIDVCHAVQHAHQKGIIHRDIKPSNVLITLHDGQPVVKVIDFGLAKAIAAKLTEKTLFTALGQMVGTPAYMSPEQAELSGLDVDTRTDVYSLGVLLYELLTGVTPLDVQQLRKAGYAEMQRLIREHTTPPMSVRLSSLGASSTIVAGHRSCDPRRLVQFLRGDLDVIVLKSLEKDRNRRYDSPNSFADDVQRFLNREAIEARPASTAYRVWKFCQRNRAAVLTGGGIAGLLVASTVVSTMLAVWATNAEAVASTRLGKIREEQRKTQSALAAAKTEEERAVAAEQLAVTRLAESEAARREAEAISQFLVNVFESPNPNQHGRGTVTVLEVLQQAERRVETEMADQPDRLATLMATMANSYQALEMHEDSVRLNRRVLEVRTGLHGERAIETLEAMHSLGNSMLELPDRRAECVPILERAFLLRRELQGGGHPRTLSTMQNLTHAYSYVEQHDMAMQLAEEMVTISLKELGPSDPRTLDSLLARANIHRRAESGEALRFFEETVEVGVKFHPERRETQNAMTFLAVLLRDDGRLEEGIRVMEKAVQLGREFLPDDVYTSESMEILAGFYNRAGRDDESISLAEESLAMNERLWGPSHRQTLMNKLNLAMAYLQARRYERTVSMLRDVLPFASQHEVIDQNALPLSVMAAELLAANGDPAGAKTLLMELMAIVEQKNPEDLARLMDFCSRQNAFQNPNAWQSWQSKAVLGGLLLELNKDSEAEPWLTLAAEGLLEREDQIPSDIRSATIDPVIERLLSLYERRNQPGDSDKAAKWKAVQVKRRP